MTEASINGKKPKFFTTPIADSGTKTDIPATGGDDTVSQQQGFPSKFSTPRGSGGKSVGRSDMNGLFNGVSSLNYYFQYMGRNPWTQNDATGYPKGAKVWYNDAEYVSTSDGNTTTPGSSATWIKLNDLSGTSGGGTTVDCAWSSRASEIGGLLTNAGKIPGLETKVNALTSDVSTLKTDMTNVKTSISSMQGEISSLKTSVSSISTKLDNLSVRPSFLNVDDYDELPLYGSDHRLQAGTESSAEVCATKDGKLMVAVNEALLSENKSLTIAIKNSSTGSYKILKTIGIEKQTAKTAPAGSNCVEVDVKAGQWVSVAISSLSGSDMVTFSSYYVIHYF